MTEPAHKQQPALRALTLLLWAALAGAVWYLSRGMTIGSVLDMTPKNRILAALFLMALFVIKSLTMVLHSGLFYGAAGALYSLPEALAVGMAGSVLMFSIPFFIGRRLGRPGSERLLQKYPRLRRLRELETEAPFLVCLAARVAFFLPLDPVSLYFGAAGTGWVPYILSSCLGVLPSMVTYTLIGRSLSRPNITAVVLSAAAYAAGALLAIRFLWKRSGETGRK